MLLAFKVPIKMNTTIHKSRKVYCIVKVGILIMYSKDYYIVSPSLKYISL